MKLRAPLLVIAGAELANGQTWTVCMKGHRPSCFSVPALSPAGSEVHNRSMVRRKLPKISSLRVREGLSDLGLQKKSLTLTLILQSVIGAPVRSMKRVSLFTMYWIELVRRRASRDCGRSLILPSSKG